MRRLAIVVVIASAVAAQASRPASAHKTAFGDKARAKIDSLIQASGADVGVAFRTLDGRDELLINPDVEFHAASTMKVPVMIELFRRAYARTLRLDDEIPVVNEFHSIVDGSPYTLAASEDSDHDVYKRIGGRMSYRDLCEAMITTSSNLAANLLIERLGATEIQATADRLGARGLHVLRGVEDDKAFAKGLNNTTTARALLTLMQKIADGTAVDSAASAEMVAILERQHFNDRIPAGLPSGTRVAHKTGEITKIQHDAAIVYAPRPFALVVLVRGLQDPTQGAALTANIAKVLYEASQDRGPERAAPQQNRGAALWGPPGNQQSRGAALSGRQGNQQSRGAALSGPPADATAQLLSEVIRVDSSNPPGKTADIAALLDGRMKTLGFETEIVQTPEAGKVHFFARLKGDGSKRPVLIAAHSDVVGVERDKWETDPFGGLIRGDHVYGRGAIDFKGGIAVFARAAMMLAENKIPLARDVVFLSEADEEGAQYNTSWLARTHWDRMDCEFALNEGGWIIKDDAGKVKYVSISTADKGSVNIVLTAKGTSTHSSMPRPDNAIFTLGRALAKLADYDTKVQLTPSTKQFFLTLAKTSAPPLSDHFRTIATSTDAAAIARADREVSRDPLIHALLRNTIAPVLMNAGFRGNVIPGSAEATINIRTIPGTKGEDLVREFQQVVNDPRVDVKLAGAGLAGIPASSEDTDLFRALTREARQLFPGAEVTPYLFQAGTDAGAWRSRGVPVYGIYPYPISADELTRMHGNDERVSVESLRQGTEMIYRTLVDVAGKGR